MVRAASASIRDASEFMVAVNHPVDATGWTTPALLVSGRLVQSRAAMKWRLVMLNPTVIGGRERR
jgi:hypothetical protein